MKRKVYFLLFAGMLIGGISLSMAETTTGFPDCRDYTRLSQDLRSIQEANPDLIRLSSLAKTREGRDVWLVEIGTNAKDTDSQPAILITAGIEGNDLAGTEAVLELIERISKEKQNEDIQKILESTTFFIIPRLNPDAAECYFISPRKEMDRNLTATDDDLDGLSDEDGPNDLNSDGQISWIRIEDPEGTFIPYPDDERIAIEADSGKGENGRWLYKIEGKDDDDDEKIDEDGPGGVNLNKNFPYDFPWFEKDAGVHQLCEKETRALAEFIVAHPNIGIVFTFSKSSNLLKEPESGDAPSREQAQTKIRKEDVKYFEQLGNDYRDLVSITKTVDTDSSGGSFADWMYFHRGRLSLTSPVWNPDIALALKKPDQDEEKDSSESKESNESEKQEKSKDKKDNDKEEDKRGKTELDYLKWVEENAPGYFIPWTEIDHPDFPDQRVEVGGWAPYAKVLPPAQLLPELAAKNAGFLLGLADKLPRIHIQDAKVKPLGHDIYDIRLQVENTGYLSTVLAHGERTREIFPTRITLNVPDESILGGEKNVRLGAIEGSGGNVETRYVIKAEPGTKVTFTVISALAGKDQKTVELREGR